MKPTTRFRPRLPDRDQPHFHKKKIVVVVIVGLLILSLAALAVMTSWPG